MIMVITVTLLAAYALTTLVIYRQNVNLMEQETRQEANYIVKAIEISGTDYLKQMDEVEKNTRITLIDSAGDVLYDSTEDAVTLQNHKNRPEIKAAHKNGTGQEVRRSTTMSKEMFYYAKLLPDGNVLRVSKTMNTALHTAISILPIMGLIAVVALAFAYLLSRQQVAKLIRPINELDLEEPLENEVYEELTPLLESIDKQNKEKEAIANMMGDKYVHPRHFSTKTKGAQEAHEAIRPTYMENAQIEGSAQEKKLYDLIWKRTIASQMADAELEKTTATISISNTSEAFSATGEVVKFDGFLRVYRESYDDDVEQEDETHLLPPLKKGQKLEYQNITATERFTQHPPRYTEASLVRKLEELGIGRPSTYAPTISTVQQREYVEKGDKTGEERSYNVITLKKDKITDATRTEITGAEKAKLLPTDTGTVVTDFLTQYFPSIMDYNFTASVEKQFDEIAEGDTKWTTIMKTFYKTFHPSVESTLAAKNAHKTGERILGDDPVSGKPVSVKIGRFGPVVQIGSAEDEEKPRFSPLKKGQSIETITLAEAMELFKLPRTLGEHEGKTVTVNAGRFGPYIYYSGTYTSLPKGVDPMEIELEEALELIKEKAEAEAKKHLKKFDEEPELEIMNGRYGPYIAYKGSNYKIPKDIVPEDLNLDACMEIIKLQSEKAASAPAKPKRGKYTKKKA